jgi:hypothetical protein
MLEPIKKQSGQPKSHEPLSNEKRLRRVLASQGRPPHLATALPENVKSQLAALCGADGTLVADARPKSKAILDDYFDSQKAVVDEPPETGDEESRASNKKSLNPRSSIRTPRA